VTHDISGLDTRLAKAMSHPLRQRLLMAYTGRVLSPSQAAEELGESLGDVSYHTKQLLAQGCVELVQAVRGRGGVKHYYRATVPFEFPDSEWSALSPALRGSLASSVVDTIAGDLDAAAAAGALGAEDVHLSRTRLELDERGRRELSALLERVVADALRLQRESAERRGDAAGGEQSVLAILHFDRSRAGGG
jgi:DNA-binding transcriptional ArsR family regulator